LTIECILIFHLTLPTLPENLHINTKKLGYTLCSSDRSAWPRKKAGFGVLQKLQVCVGRSEKVHSKCSNCGLLPLKHMHAAWH